MKRKGFTLAEVLIVLAILGVLATILLPVIKNSQPNQEHLMFRKAYYLLSNIVAELVNDEELYPESDESTTSFLGNTSTITEHGVTYSGVTKFCNLVASRLNTISESVCDNTNTDFTISDDGEISGSFITQDGIAWSLPTSSSFADVESQDAILDVNGAKAPNCQSGTDGCDNPDRFVVKIHRTGKLTVSGVKEREYLNSTNVTR